jgi:predicted metal-dependent phosphoesterase TrpH
MSMLRTDLHTHTYYSPDALTSPPDFVNACLRRDVNCVAITEHNTVRGALAMLEMCPFKVIVGEEILTADGEIIGLFLKEEVPPLLSAEETVRLIKEQGALVSIPHPFDRLRRKSLGEEALLRIVDQVDIIETFNARVTFASDNERSRRFAQKNSLLAAAVSDAHTPGELGSSYIEMPDFDGPEAFLQSLRQAKLVTRAASPLVHVLTGWARLRRKVFGWKPV